MPDDAVTHTLVITPNKAVCLSHSRIITEIPKQREGVIPDGDSQ